ncbi:MAG: DHH family phosphoesterase [Bacteroidota bacterium]
MTRSSVTQIEWKNAQEILEKSKTIFLTAHRNPDPDAVGALLAMYNALLDQGKEVYMAVEGKIPNNLHFLKGWDQLGHDFPVAQRPDLIVSLDSDDLSVLGNAIDQLKPLRSPLLVIDHHHYNEYYGDYHIVNSEYVSTTEALFDLFQYLNWPIDKEIAKALIIGIMSDTQMFKVGGVNHHTFERTQVLMATGLDYRALIERVFTTVASGHLQLLGRILARAILQDHVIWSWQTPQDREELGLDDSFGISAVDELIKDNQGYIAALFKVKDEHAIKVSLRAIPGFDVGTVADSLGGGGHILAAGCLVKTDSLEEAIEKVVPLLKTAILKGKPKYET